MFIAKDGANLLKAWHAVKPNGIERCIFIESGTDAISSKVLRIKQGDLIAKDIAKSVAQLTNKKWLEDKKNEFTNQEYNNYFKAKEVNVTQEQYTYLAKTYQNIEKTEDLFAANLYINDIINRTTGAIQSYSSGVFVHKTILAIGNTLNDFLNYIRIDEKYWNPENKEYEELPEEKLINLLLSKIDSVQVKLDTLRNAKDERSSGIMNLAFAIISKILDGVKIIFEGFTTVQQFARGFICGVLNGVIDVVNGFVWLLKQPSNAVVSSLEFAENASSTNDYASYQLELVDNMLDAFYAIEWEKVFDEVKKNILELPQVLSGYNAGQWGYFVGFAGFQILEFFVPITKLAKLAKVKNIAKAPKILSEALQGIQKSVGNVASTGKKALQATASFIETLIELLKEGTAALIKKIQLYFAKLKDKVIEQFIKFVVIKNGKELTLLFSVIPEAQLIGLLLKGGYKGAQKAVQAILKKVTGLEFLEELSEAGEKIYVIAYKGVKLKEGKLKVVEKFVKEVFDSKNYTKYLDELAEEAKNLARLGIKTDGQNWLWKNPFGTELRWPKLSKKKILENIEIKRVKDIIGDVFEGDVGKELYRLAKKYGDKMTDFSNQVWAKNNKGKPVVHLGIKS